MRQQEELVEATLLWSLEHTDLIIYFGKDWIQNSVMKRRSVWGRGCVAYDVARIEGNAWSISGMWRLTIWKQNKTLVKSRLGPLLALEQDKVASWKSLVLHFEVAMKALGRKYQFFSTTSLICSLKSQMFHTGWM